MASNSEKPLLILFFPLMSPGHFIPMVDMAVIFSSCGVRATLVTTPANAATVLTSSPKLSIVTVPFPSPDKTHLPLGKENLSSIPSSLFDTFTGSLRLFRRLLEPIIVDRNPDCIISDSLTASSPKLFIFRPGQKKFLATPLGGGGGGCGGGGGGGGRRC